MTGCLIISYKILPFKSNLDSLEVRAQIRRTPKAVITDSDFQWFFFIWVMVSRGKQSSFKEGQGDVVYLASVREKFVPAFFVVQIKTPHVSILL